MKNSLIKQDHQIAKLITAEAQRQRDGMELIPSENIVSPAVREAMGSILTNKYSEGYPHHRYYGGQSNIDQIEDIARERAKKLFDVPHVNVQPYSGSPANLAVYVATCKPGDTIMGHALLDGGHLTHGHMASATSMFYNAIQYHVKKNGYLDMAEIEKLAKKHKPKVIWVGATAYVRKLPFAKIAKIADSVGAYLVADTSHITGLIIAGAHPSPVKHAHIITTTTHKTLRGPRGGMIMVTQKGLDKDADLAKKIDQAIFPRLQGGPHDHQTAAIAVALNEASTASFRSYGKKIVKNADILAQELKKYNIPLVSGGTSNHMMLVKCGTGRGAIIEIALDAVGITANKNTIPNDLSSPFYPSGLRIGTPSITTRGMGMREMKKIAAWIKAVMDIVADENLPKMKNKRKVYLIDFKNRIEKDTRIKAIATDVQTICRKFPTL